MNLFMIYMYICAINEVVNLFTTNACKATEITKSILVILCFVFLFCFHNPLCCNQKVQNFTNVKYTVWSVLTSVYILEIVIIIMTTFSSSSKVV